MGPFPRPYTVCGLGIRIMMKKLAYVLVIIVAILWLLGFVLRFTYNLISYFTNGR